MQSEFSPAGGVCPNFSLAPEAGDQNTCPVKDGLSTYIVRYTDYQEASVQRMRLQHALQRHPIAWEWIDRHNPASRLPTDFGLVRVAHAQVPVLERTLRHGLKSFRDVLEDRSFRSPLNLRVDAAEFASSPTKPPGRMQTRPTIGLEPVRGDDDPYSFWNTSGDPGRELLGVAPTLPERLGADVLWTLGYRGTGVKVGIFDTGIRANHPNVRNIKYALLAMVEEDKSVVSDLSGTRDRQLYVID